MVRAPDGAERLVVIERVSKGFLSARTTVLSLPLPLFDPRERECSVVLARGQTVLDRTDWRPRLRGDARGAYAAAHAPADGEHHR